MISKLREIITGWKNLKFPGTVTERLAKKRSKHCSGCREAEKSGVIGFLVKDKIKEVQGYKCGLCNCPLSAKIRSPESKCDLGKWES